MDVLEDEINSLNLPNLIGKNFSADFNDYWKSRRKEIKCLLQEEYLGDWPGELEIDVSKLSTPKTDVLSKHLQIGIKGAKESASFEFDLYIPDQNENKIPCFIFLNFEDDVKEDILKEITGAGFALVNVNYQNIEPDITSDEPLNVQKLINNFEGKSWGKIGAWAYGGSKIVDYLITLPEIDSNSIAIIGHSRLGLAAAWCGAMDERIALTICNNNGALYRGTKAESYTDLSRDYTRHWFAKKAFINNRDESQIPFDMHFLHALIAPRHLYLAGAKKDQWCDAHSQLLSVVAASKVFENLNFSNKNVGFVNRMKRKDGLESYPYGSIGFHLREGEHDLKIEDWREFINYRKLHNI